MQFAQDIVLLHFVGLKPVVVHGGGKKITDLLSKLDIPTSFVDGQRVTTREIMGIAEMVLSGDINKEIVALLNTQGAKALGCFRKRRSFFRSGSKRF